MQRATEKLFRRGLELFGQQASRLDGPGYRDAIRELGVVVCEGPNDVLRLDSLGVPSVAICSNTITAPQAAKVAKWANPIGNGVATVMLDCDEEGQSGSLAIGGVRTGETRDRSNAIISVVIKDGSCSRVATILDNLPAVQYSQRSFVAGKPMLDPENKSDRPNDVDVADESGSPDTDAGKSGLRRFSGIWKGHPDLKEFRDNVDAYRRSVDESSE